MKTCNIEGDFVWRQKNQNFCFVYMRLFGNISRSAEKFPVSLRVVYIKKLFLKVLQNVQEDSCTRLCPRCFPENFAKYLRTPSLQTTSGRLWMTFRHLKDNIHSEVPGSFLFKLLRQLLICFAIAPYLATLVNVYSS